MFNNRNINFIFLTQCYDNKKIVFALDQQVIPT